MLVRAELGTVGWTAPSSDTEGQAMQHLPQTSSGTWLQAEHARMVQRPMRVMRHERELAQHMAPPQAAQLSSFPK